MLKVHNLIKHFGDNKAVKGVSFEIKEGEIFTLIGPNSSGKTTIVKNILGLLQPTSGTITIGGIDVSKKPFESKSLTGYIPDEPSVWSTMTGEEFLNFTQALYGVSESERKTNNKKLLSLFALEGLEKQSFDEYSRGNKQKFSIIAALSHNPKLLIVDEPIVGLDPTGAEIAKKLFMDFTKEGGSVLLVTHTLPVAEEISDRIGLLKDGHLIEVGTMEELRAKAGLGTHTHLDDVYKKLA